MNTTRITFRKVAIAVLFTLMVLMGVIGVSACDKDDYRPKTDIPGINSNAVLNIEKTQLSFALGMDLDFKDAVVRCGCVLTDDEGHEVAVTKQHLTDGAVTFSDFELDTVGVNKRVTVSYKNASNYIFYDVTDYSVELYSAEGTQWKSVSASAELDRNNDLAVYIDLNAFNYSTDSAVRANDGYHAERFNGWFTEEGEPATGRYAMPAVSAEKSTLKLHAEYLTDAQYDLMDLSYDGLGRRVFAGYNGASREEVVIPEGVTYVDMFALFAQTPSTTPINFKGLDIPSTAQLDLPLTSAINTRGLEYVTVDGGNPQYSSFEGALYSKSFRKLYFMPASCAPDEFHGSVTEFDSFSCSYWEVMKFRLPDSVDTLGDYCFAHSALTEVIGIDRVETIKNGIFWGSAVPSVNEGGGYYSVGSNGKYLLSNVDKETVDFKIKEGTVAISAKAFADCAKLKSVDLGDELEEIGEYAFLNCKSLQSVTLPSTVTEIGNHAFYACSALETVNLENVRFSRNEENAYSLPLHLFDGCSKLKNVELPVGIEKIGTYAFNGCSALTGLDLHNVREIEGYAFYKSGLLTIDLPESLSELGRSAFAMSKLKSVDLSKCVKITAIPERCFQQCKLTQVTVPAHITEIGEYAFYYISTLKSVKLESVEIIGTYAFGTCSKLVGIDFGDSLRIIEKRAFSSTAFTELDIPDTVEEIHGYAFVCPQLVRLSLGANVRIFGDYAFADDNETFKTSDLVLYTANNLEEITVSPQNKYFKIVNGALYGSSACGKDYGECGVLYFMPPAVKGITAFTDDPHTKIVLPYAFQGQKSLTEVTFSAGIENIGKVVFYASSSLERLNIASTIDHIGVNLLLDCAKDVEVVLDENEKIRFEDDVLYSGTTALLGSAASGVVRIKEGTTLIAAGTFMNNSKITKVYIPDSVTQIEDKAFAGCANLDFLSIGAGVRKLDGTPFQRLPSLTSIEVSKENRAFKTVYGNMLYSYDGKTLVLCAAANGITDLSKMLSTVETIGAYAFSDHKTLADARLPLSVKKLGNYAFYECRALETFYASEALEEIGEYAFSFKDSIDPEVKTENRCCDSLRTVLIYGNLKKLGKYAFYGQYGIEDVFYNMNEAQIKSFWANPNIGGTTNSSYLHHGCPNNTDGGYYNPIKSYLYSRGQPQITVAGYGWFRFDESGNPVKW